MARQEVQQVQEAVRNEVSKRFEQMKDMGISVRDMLMEFIGTCLFMLIGMLVVVYAKKEARLSDPVVSDFVVAFAFGMAITVMIYMTAHTSGGQLNPAITAGCMAAGVTTPMQAAANIISQCAGGILSAFLLILLVPHDVRHAAAMAVNMVPAGSNVFRAFLGEVIGMFMIQLTILEAATHTKSQALSSAPLAIGTTFVVCILAFAPVSSGSFNPARSLGPALLSGKGLKHLWIFIFAPFIGGVLAAPVHLFSLSGWDTKKERNRAPAPGPFVAQDSAQEALLPNRA